MTTIKHLHTWFGLVVGQAEWDRHLAGIDNVDVRASALAVGDVPVLLRPPAFTTLAGDSVQVGPFSAVVRGEHLYVEGAPKVVDFSTATHGSVTGPVDVVTPGKHRYVVVLARYKDVQAVPVLDLDGDADFQELHHGVEFRVVMGDEFTLGVEDGSPSDYGLEIEGGSVPLLVVLRDDAQVNTLTANYVTRLVLRDVALHMAMLARTVRDGVVVADDSQRNDPRPYSVSVVMVEVSPGQWYAELEDGDGWVARLDGTMLDSDMETPTVGRLRSDGALPGAGTFMVRIRVDDEAPNWRPKLYVADASGYPDADGESFDSYPASLRGDETVPGAFPSTARDVALALVTYDGVLPPAVQVVTNPPEFVHVEDVPADYSVAPVLVHTISLPETLGRELLLSVVPQAPDAGSFPGSRGVPHNFYSRVRYVNFDEVSLEIRASYLDTSGPLAVPGTVQHFRPPVRVYVQAAAPRT